MGMWIGTCARATAGAVPLVRERRRSPLAAAFISRRSPATGERSTTPRLCAGALAEPTRPMSAFGTEGDERAGQGDGMSDRRFSYNVVHGGTRLAVPPTLVGRTICLAVKPAEEPV